MLTLEYFFKKNLIHLGHCEHVGPESKAIEVIRTASLCFNRPWITLVSVTLKQTHAIYHLKAKELNTFQQQHIH